MSTQPYSVKVGYRSDLARFERLCTVRIANEALRRRSDADNGLALLGSTEHMVLDNLLVVLRGGADNGSRGAVFRVTHARPHQKSPSPATQSPSSPTTTAASPASASPACSQQNYSPAMARSASNYVLPPQPRRVHATQPLPPASTPADAAPAPAVPSVDYELSKAVLKVSKDARGLAEARWMGRLYRELVATGRSPNIAVLLRYVHGASSKVGAWLRNAGDAEASWRGDMHCLVIESADGGSLHARLLHEPPFSPDVALRCAFQMTHALYQMQRVGGTQHRDLHHGNILFKTIGADVAAQWPSYANVLTGDTDAAGEPTFAFYDAFSAGAPLVKIIDFESASRSTADRIRAPATAICARPPEQLLASLRATTGAGAAATAVHSMAGDTFSLGLMLVDMLLDAHSPHARPSWGAWNVAIMRPSAPRTPSVDFTAHTRAVPASASALSAAATAEAPAAPAATAQAPPVRRCHRLGCIVVPGDEQYYARIGAVLAEFNERVQRDERCGTVTASAAASARWRSGGDPHLLTYVHNLVYLLGAPRLADLPFVDGAADYLWHALFARFAAVCTGGRLGALLEHNCVPRDAADMLVRVLRWSPAERAWTFDMLGSAYFAALRVGAGEHSVEQFVCHMHLGDRVHAIFGDEPSLQSSQALQRRRARLAALVSTPQRLAQPALFAEPPSPRQSSPLVPTQSSSSPPSPPPPQARHSPEAVPGTPTPPQSHRIGTLAAAPASTFVSRPQGHRIGVSAPAPASSPAAALAHKLLHTTPLSTTAPGETARGKRRRPDSASLQRAVATPCRVSVYDSRKRQCV